MNDAIPADGLPNAADLDRPVSSRRPLVIAMAITTTFFVVELVGAYVSNSLALLADAAHMLTDVAALGLALAMWLATRVTRPERTFGYLRAEILAALVNAVSLIVLAIYIFWEAWQRLQEPPEVESGPSWSSPSPVCSPTLRPPGCSRAAVGTATISIPEVHFSTCSVISLVPWRPSPRR